MTNIVLFDYNRKNLFPFTFTRPVAELRVGILTIREHWELLLEATVSYMTEPYLSKKYPVWKEDENLFINGALIPTDQLVEASRALTLGQRLVHKGIPLAAYAEGWPDPASPYGKFRDVEYAGKVELIGHIWEIFTKNDVVLRSQFAAITSGRKSATLSATNTVISPHQVFVEEGVKAECAIINASTGPVYIGRNAEIMEGAMIRGPFALGESATVKMGAKIYGATTIGPHCKAGGEISNSVMFGFSNKAHDGFLGNSVIGEWCNLGADTNNSNLKNNYSEVRVHHIATGKQIATGLTFCGLFMGDHAKCAINTMFNTGTVVGVGANIFGAGFPPKYVPPFSWGGFEGAPVFQAEKAIQLARQVYQRRSVEFDSTEENLIRAVFNMTESPS
jgi:UDP-N-acetylglucosamine diphosphorylase/glucosamine-1-phosphate N-acetyltransferase